MHSTEGLFLMAVALTSHWNFLTILALLESFYMVLIQIKIVLKKSEAFLFQLCPIFNGSADISGLT
jgi:hypothetical protein